MQANPQNLARWIDELSATIEDLEKRVDAINYTPPTPPAPVGNYQIKETLIVNSPISDETSYFNFDISDDVFLYEVTFGTSSFNLRRIYGTYALSKSGLIGESEIFGEYTDPSGTDSCAFFGKYNYRQEGGFYEARVTSGSSSPSYYIQIRTYELEPIVTESILTRAADAVKKLVKGGK